MTKTLTEQLNNGTLKDGLYYIKDKDNDNILIGIRYCLTMTRLIDDGCSSFEVLEPMPSYDKYNELVQKIHILNEQNTKIYNELCEEIKKNNILENKLEIAIGALKDILNDGDDYWDKDKANEALTKMEGVK